MRLLIVWQYYPAQIRDLQVSQCAHLTRCLYSLKALADVVLNAIAYPSGCLDLVVQNTEEKSVQKDDDARESK